MLDFLTVSEAAAHVGVSKQAIFLAIWQHRRSDGVRGLPATRHGAAYAIAPADLARWMTLTSDRRAAAKRTP